jgi:phosphoribosylformylglycinamidine synthase
MMNQKATAFRRSSFIVHHSSFQVEGMMLWEIEIRPRGPDRERDRVGQEYNLLTHAKNGGGLVKATARGYLLEGDLTRSEAERLVSELLVDSLAEIGAISELNSSEGKSYRNVTVLLKPGVMDPVALSVVDAAHDLGISVDSVRTFRRYYLPENGSGIDPALAKVLANDAIEQIVPGALSLDHLTLGKAYDFHLHVIPLRKLDDGALEKLSREGQLSLSLAEMKAIQSHFREQGRDPTDVELETLAQTWSEHCSHKTLKGRIDFNGRRIDNLLKETIFGATAAIRRRLGAHDWCVSVFEDNAGVVRFDDQYHVCFKVETHNHPSAIEPYGGANTGLGGVIRDPLGTGLGAKPICNTDVFCFAPPDTPPEALPPGVLHPQKVMRGVVTGVRDYGNRMGIPTVNGAVCFDERYLANPLVFCGTVGLIPKACGGKEPKAGDLIVVVGGRTGRDGIHGATFSSVELSAESESASGGAVQIGNAIAEKKLVDVILQARDRQLYHAITDCGAGGFSSAIGEMGEKLGAKVQLDRALLKYQGLSYLEIWISESQERMILAVPERNWRIVKGLCDSEDVEATVIGQFETTGRLRLYYQEQQVADLDLDFLHHGRPAVVRQATWSPQSPRAATRGHAGKVDLTDTLLKILSSYNVCSKEWIIRQYDHEVQGGSVIKPLVGVQNDGPGDAAVVMPVLGSNVGLAVGCGINPRYGDHDPYWMAASAIDEAVRNVVAVGADPQRIALLDNFCWGNTDRPEVLGSLIRAAEACRDAALAYDMPFISGKDSLNNEYHSGGRHIVIPPTLLISALGRVPDVRGCVTMDLKEPGNLLFIIGVARNEMGGSHFNLVHGIEGGTPPKVDMERAPRIFHKLHEVIRRGLIRSCHDVSEGGLAVAIAEMCLAGGLGAVIDSRLVAAELGVEVCLFSESNTRFLIEISNENEQQVVSCFAGIPCQRIGAVTEEPHLRISSPTHDEQIISASVADLKEAWQKPLRW